tara:strand:+ start:741 stop:2792 length:2052 start_codon:yes stop_codon:yes gene_type:complete
LSQNKEIVTLDIEGMTCAACAVRIEKVIQKNTPESIVNVSFPLKTAEIELDTSNNINELIAKIEKIGYKAKVHEEVEEGSKPYTKFILPLFSLIASRGISLLIDAGYELAGNILGVLIVLLLGRKFHLSSINNLIRFQFNMDTLISLGSLSAIVITFLPLESAPSFIDTGAYIVSFVLIGKTIEEISIKKTISVTEAIEKNYPKKIRVINGSSETYRDISLVEIGDVIRVNPGELIPLDGVLEEGTTLVDESVVTGESIPLNKEAGSELISGSINLISPISLKVSAISNKSTFSQIVSMVKQAQLSKPSIQKTIDGVTGIFVPVVLLVSFVTFLLRFLVLEQNLLDSLSSGIAVLVIACPCALGLATPLVLYKSVALANSEGIIFKNYDVLERLNKINALIFDKTGTLTTGVLKIKLKEKSKTYAENEILSLIASVERYSNHPIAKSILLEAENRDVPLYDASKVVEIAGEGISGIVNKKNITIKKNLDPGNNSSSLTVEIDNESIQIDLEEELNADSLLIEDLSSRFKLAILSGDTDIKTGQFAELLEIEDAIGNLTPSDKKKKIESLQKNFNIAYVGDGINDAPSLKQANIGIAAGTSTEIARSAGDIILLKGGVEKINTIFSIAKDSFSRIKQNLFFAFIYNAAMIPVAIAGKISPRYAAIAMALSSISVVLNSSRRIKI